MDSAVTTADTNESDNYQNHEENGNHNKEKDTSDMNDETKSEPEIQQPSDLINILLHKESLLKIFSFLDIVSLCRCAQVSRYWNRLALDPENWQNISLFNLRNRVKSSVLENIANRYGSHLRRINLRGCKSVSDKSIQVLSQNCPLLEEVSLDDCNQLTDQACISLAKHCNNIVYLNIASCNITDSTLEAIGKYCNNLKLIDISNCNKIRPAGIESLVKNCPDIVSFICVACGPSTINDDSLKFIGEYCPKLKLINLNGCYAISDQGVRYISDGCHSLISLCLSKCHNITDQSLMSIGQGCRELRTIGLINCVHLTDNGFQALAQNCRLLENLDIEDCGLVTDQTLCYLTSNCFNLKRLALSHCDKITDEGIRYIGQSEKVSASIKYLELDNCTQLTDATIDHLLNCKHLKRLDIYDNNRISHQATRKLYTYLPQMEIRTYIQSTSSPEQAVTEARHRYYKCCAIL